MQSFIGGGNQRKPPTCSEGEVRIIHLICTIASTLLCLLQGGKEYLMRAHFNLPSVMGEDTEGKPPIHVKFEIPYFTVSGIQVC